MTRIRLLRDGAIGRIILARPGKRNALDRQTAEELFAALAQFESDPACRVIHLGAEGEDFSTGADLAELARGIDAGGDAHRADAERQRRHVHEEVHDCDGSEHAGSGRRSCASSGAPAGGTEHRPIERRGARALVRP